MKMKTIATTAFALVLSTSFALAQGGQAQGGASTGRTTNSSANSEKPGMNSGMSNSENFGIRNSEKTEPGDFAVTDGLSGRGRTGDSIGKVVPGTSNSPGPNSGGE
jgi:hypothetical protein